MARKFRVKLFIPTKKNQVHQEILFKDNSLRLIHYKKNNLNNIFGGKIQK